MTIKGVKPLISYADIRMHKEEEILFPYVKHLKKLKKEGYISNYVARLDYKKLGLKQIVFVGITLQGHTRSYLEKFVKEIQSFPELLN